LRTRQVYAGFLPNGQIALRTVALPYGGGNQPLVIFALTHKMYGPTIAEPQYVVAEPSTRLAAV
jgi:hypothetical protein